MGKNTKMISADWWGAFLFIPLPWIIKYLLPPATAAEHSSLRVPFFDDLKELGAVTNITRTKGFTYRLTAHFIWFFLLLAASGIHWIGEPIKLPSEGRDLMIAVDLSKSMYQEDYQLKGDDVDRLTAVKSVMKEFIDRRKNDRLGLILFGSQAYLQSPLTFDRQIVGTLLDEAEIGIAGPKTAIGDAIGLAIKRLKDKPSESRVLILLTDGSNTAGHLSPIKAAELAASIDLKIYTIGIGAKEQLVRGLFGTFRNNPSKDLDESTLADIAKLTGGRYFRGEDMATLDEIYNLLDQLEPIESDQATLRPRRALYFWPLGMALVLSALMALQHILKNGVQAVISI